LYLFHHLDAGVNRGLSMMGLLKTCFGSDSLLILPGLNFGMIMNSCRNFRVNISLCGGYAMLGSRAQGILMQLLSSLIFY